MRTLKRPDTPILSGYRIHHNYIRPHEALEGATASGKAGITVKGKDNWLTIIQNASRRNSYENEKGRGVVLEVQRGIVLWRCSASSTCKLFL
jgi:hypothetical protein